jgi:hypothetical protein
MLLDSFGLPIPVWFSPVITFAIVGFFLWKSIRYEGALEAEDFAEGLPDAFSPDDEQSPERD